MNHPPDVTWVAVNDCLDPGSFFMPRRLKRPRAMAAHLDSELKRGTYCGRGQMLRR